MPTESKPAVHAALPWRVGTIGREVVQQSATFIHADAIPNYPLADVDGANQEEAEANARL